ncbi:hypothetical protein FH972_004482 [Carpinus fangiana]|uniref:Uncharacterized protein n=1 Tax=Carpinus fangiana TaxID=176857 RepID=A0A5N6QLE4_9ROSI|nr:hypothetical protein FH972_004482 [Carpinus fangiana]
MNGYSKMKAIDTQKSRSMDFSDALSFSQTKKTNSDPTSKPHEGSQIKESNAEKEDGDGGNGEKFGAVLSRSCSVSSTSGFQSAVKRAFSVKRSSSVSERYCRIYDQSVTLASPIDDDDDEGWDTMRATRRSVKKKKHKGGKILKACKRLFGL